MANNQNMFNNPNNPMNKMSKMLPKRSNSTIRLIASLLFGLLPLIITMIFIEPNNTSHPFMGEILKTSFSYGEYFGIGILVIIGSVILVSLLAFLLKDLNRDVLAPMLGWSIGMFSIYIFLPIFDGYWSLFLIIIFPIFWIVGYIGGALGMLIFTMINLNKEMKRFYDENEDVKKQHDEMIKQMQKQQQMNQHFQDNKNSKNDKKNDEEEWKDNPFVDVDDENENK